MPGCSLGPGDSWDEIFNMAKANQIVGRKITIM